MSKSNFEVLLETMCLKIAPCGPWNVGIDWIYFQAGYHPRWPNLALVLLIFCVIVYFGILMHV